VAAMSDALDTLAALKTNKKKKPEEDASGELQDETLTCKDCGAEFVFSVDGSFCLLFLLFGALRVFVVVRARSLSPSYAHHVLILFGFFRSAIPQGEGIRREARSLHPLPTCQEREVERRPRSVLRLPERQLRPRRLVSLLA